MIIAIEGLDGAGKTVVGQAFAGRLDATYMTLPPAELALRDSTIFGRHDSPARYLHYLSGVASIAEAARAGGPVVADRFVASAHALHLHVPGSVAESLRGLAWPSADITFFLDVDETERRDRLARRSRPLDPFERALNDDDEFRAAVSGHLRSYAGTHVVDTTGRRPEAIVTELVDVWNSKIGGTG